MIRRVFFAFLTAGAARIFGSQAPSLPLLIDVGPGKHVTVTFRGYEETQLADLVSFSLMRNEDAASRQHLGDLLRTASGLTIIMTTSRDRITPAPK